MAETIIPSDANFDFHMHTNFTDGESSVDEMITSANEKRLDKIAITEHVRRDSPWVGDYVAAVRDGREGSATDVVLGFETKLLDMDGTLDMPEEALDNAELVICSLHRIPGLHDMGGDIAISEMNTKETKGVYIEALKAICRNDSVNVIGHPFDLLYKFDIPLPNKIEMHDLARYIGSHGKAVELNTNYKVPPLLFVQVCMLYDVKFSIGSDAHHASRVGDVYWAAGILELARGSKQNLMEKCLS